MIITFSWNHCSLLVAATDVKTESQYMPLGNTRPTLPTNQQIQMRLKRSSLLIPNFSPEIN